jgi:hypothetical protein
MAGLAEMTLLSKIALGASAAGTVLSTTGQIVAAQNAKNIASVNAENTRRISVYNASINEQAAGQEEAVSQLKAKEELRQSRLKQSRVLALVGASGGGTLDQDVMNIIGGFAEEGDYNARSELYQGSERARNLRTQGQAGIWQGESSARSIQYEGASKASELRSKATGTLMAGASSLASKYGAYLR